MAIKPKGRVKKWLRPNAVEREYVRFVRTIAAETNAAMRELVIPTVQAWRLDGVEDTPPTTGMAEELRLALMAALDRVLRVPIAQRIATFSRQISTFNQRQFRAVLRKAYGVDIIASEPWLVEVLTQWEAENIALIKSIPREGLDKLQGRILQSWRAGRPVKELTQTIYDMFDVTYAKAELIAVDQVGKLNGQLTMERQKRTGITSYKWRGSLDQRERDHHVEREGKVFTWDNPPWDGHPGIAIRCRCTAEAVLPLLDDIEGLQFPDLTPARGDRLTQLRQKAIR